MAYSFRQILYIISIIHTSYSPTSMTISDLTISSLAVIILSSLCEESVGQCPGQTESLCSSCVNKTAVCSGRCIGKLSLARSYTALICTSERESIHNVDLSFNFLIRLECTLPRMLKTLNVSRNNITIEDCSYWETECSSSFTKLEYIDLSFNRIRNTCNTSAVFLPRLKHVNLSHNDVTSLENLPFFTTTSNISVLDLSYNNITYLPWDPFVRKPSLTSLNISHNNVHQLFTCRYFALKPPRQEIFDACRDKNNVSTSIDSFFNSLTGSCVKSVAELNVDSWVGIQCSKTLFKDEKVLRNEFRMETCTLNVKCYVIGTATPSEIDDSRRPFLRISISNLIGAVIVVFLLFTFIITICLKFLHIIKERQIAKSDNVVVDDELYTNISPKLTEFAYKRGPCSEDITQRVYYSKIPDQENPGVVVASWEKCSSLPSDGSIGETVYKESTVFGHERVSGEGIHSLGLDTVEIFSREVRKINEMRKLSWYQSTENIKGSISYEDIDENDNFKTIYAKIDKDNRSQESNDSEEPSFVENMECRLNLTKQFTSNLPIYYKSTDNPEESICYHTIPSSGEDVDKNDNVKTIYAKIDEENNNQGSDDSEETSFLENIKCLNLRKESTSNLLTNPFDHENSLLRNSIGSCHFKDEETNEEKDDLNQYMGIIEGPLYRNKSKSLDMVANPCYESTTSQNFPVGSGQMSTEYEIIDEDDLRYES